MADNYLGKAIRRARVEAGMPTHILADMVGRGKKAVEAWETGTNQPSPSMLADIARVLGVPITDFFPHDLMPSEKFQLSYDELELIDSYRKMDKRGKAALLVIADETHPSSDAMANRYGIV